MYKKQEKCKWKVRKVDFLEIIIRSEGIRIKEKKLKVVLDWLISKLVKNIQKFLGLTNYYKRFVKEFVKIVKLLHKLIKKEQK